MPERSNPSLTPNALKDAPALIEAVFPAQKVSFEAQKERKAGASQTLTALGSYWKGRKPLILVRAIILGSLLPQTEDKEKDLEIFELLMAFDEKRLAKRALIQNNIKPKEIASILELERPWDFFAHNIKPDNEYFNEVDALSCPFNSDEAGINLRWRRDISEDNKRFLFDQYLTTLASYEDKSMLCKRPEEVDQFWLYKDIWGVVNSHLSKFGINANSHQELVEQLGFLRYGHRPKVGDTFSGGGSIPFEAARIGCDSYASDLNPISCMLTWGAINIIGSSDEYRLALEKEQKSIYTDIDNEICELGIEHDSHGNRAKAFLYCLETKCPETDWLVPLLPNRILSVKYKSIVELEPDHKHKRFNIIVSSNVTTEDLRSAKTGTLQDGSLCYKLDGKTYKTPIKTLRGDYRDQTGVNRNRLRKWEQKDFKPREDDIFQERLYAIQWITKETLGKARQEVFFSGITDKDIFNENLVEEIVRENITEWQENGLIPDMEIESGDKTDEPIKTRGWTYWHHLFNPRALLLQALKLGHAESPIQSLRIARDADRLSKLCRYNFNPQPSQGPKIEQVFSDQAINTLYNWGTYSFVGLEDYFSKLNFRDSYSLVAEINNHPANEVGDYANRDIFITDPPYADAVNYHEITEFFIAWLRKNPPKPFDKWTWDSRRALAIKGSDDEFRKNMADAYRAMTNNMPDNGMQCVMFTHQDREHYPFVPSLKKSAGQPNNR